jgi:hypothetical protein
MMMGTAMSNTATQRLVRFSAWNAKMFELLEASELQRLAGALLGAAVDNQQFGGGLCVSHDGVHPAADAGQAMHLARAVLGHLARGLVRESADVGGAGAGKDELGCGAASALSLRILCIHWSFPFGV